MSVGLVGAPRVAEQQQQQGSLGKAIAGTAVGAGVGTLVGIGTVSRLAFPKPLAIAAGVAIGGPIAAVSLLNNTGKPSSAWTSLAVGAGPLAVVGGAIGAFGGAWQGGKSGLLTGALGGALMFGAAGAAIAGVTHWLTKPD